jgi:CheY-like chemotaxis protein
VLPEEGATIWTDNMAVAIGYLTQLGYRTDVAANGRQALDMIAKKRYGMDGYTATTELRKREDPDRRIPVIAMTAGALAENPDRCLAAGMDDFISKPQDATPKAPPTSRMPSGRTTGRHVSSSRSCAGI